MSVRVNLLPEATKQRDRAAQQRALAGLAAVGLLAILGGVNLWANSQVNTAEDQLLAEQTHTSELRSDQAELIAFEELADRHQRSDEVLRMAMGSEISLAGFLQDIAAVVPTDTQLEAVSFTVRQPTDEDPTTLATFNVNGKTLTSHAPGVERVLLALDKIVSFRELHLNSSTLDDPEERIATFSLDGQVGPEAATGRYVEGLPEERR